MRTETHEMVITSSDTFTAATELAMQDVDIEPNVGCTATLRLVSRADLNGKRCSLLAWVESRSRWAALVHGSHGAPVLVKPTALELVQLPSEVVGEACLAPDVIDSVFDFVGLRYIRTLALTCKTWRALAVEKRRRWKMFTPVHVHNSEWSPKAPLSSLAPLPDGDLAVTALGGLNVISAKVKPRELPGGPLGPLGACFSRVRYIGGGISGGNAMESYDASGFATGSNYDSDDDDDDEGAVNWTDTPCGTAVDGGYLFVIARPDDGLVKIDPKTDRMVDEAGLYDPVSLAAAAGKVYVIAPNEDPPHGNECQVYDAADLSDPIATFGAFASEGSIGLKPAMAANATRLFVADPTQHRIDVFALGWPHAPVALPHIGERGTLPGQFLQPRGLTLIGDPKLDERLVVAEFQGQRLQVLSLTGVPLQIIPTRVPVGRDTLYAVCPSAVCAVGEKLVVGTIANKRDLAVAALTSDKPRPVRDRPLHESLLGIGGHPDVISLVLMFIANAVPVDAS